MVPLEFAAAGLELEGAALPPEPPELVELPHAATTSAAAASPAGASQLLRIAFSVQMCFRSDTHNHVAPGRFVHRCPGKPGAGTPVRPGPGHEPDAVMPWPWRYIWGGLL